MTELLDPKNAVFVIALGLLALLAVSQLLGLGDIGSDTDQNFNLNDDAGVGANLASLLGLGRLPLMAWLSLLLAIFGVGGLVVQQAAASLTGGSFPGVVAVGLTLICALPLTAFLARPLGRLWPQDETTAVQIDSLLSRRGHIEIGISTRGNPARAKVRDRHGYVHLVMVEPHVDGEGLAAGDEILLVRREGELFYAVGTNGPIQIGR